MEDNIETDLMKIGWKDVDWFHPAQDRDLWRVPLNKVINVLVP
jgi:hypothetical protein